MQNDPLWNMRHAIAGVAAAVFLSVPIAALLGSALGDWVGQSYGWRAGLYSGLLLYVVVGAGVLFAKVAQYETRPLNVQRVGVWLASLWLWPALLMVARKGAEAPAATGAPGQAERSAAPVASPAAPPSPAAAVTPTPTPPPTPPAP